MINHACLHILHEYASDSALRMNLKVRVKPKSPRRRSESCFKLKGARQSLVTSSVALSTSFRLRTWPADLYYVVDQP